MDSFHPHAPDQISQSYPITHRFVKASRPRVMSALLQVISQTWSLDPKTYKFERAQRKRKATSLAMVLLSTHTANQIIPT